MSGERSNGGHFEQEYGDSDILGVFEETAVPILTSTEVADMVGCSARTARRRLDELADEEELYRKEVGARATVYARLGDQRTDGYSEWKRSLWDGE